MNAVAAKASAALPRVLAVQTAAARLSEAVVLHPLLQAAAARGSPELEILLAQGVTRDTPRKRGDSVARWFADVPGIRVEPLRTGDLGLYGMSLRQRARKLSDLRRLRHERARLQSVAAAFRPQLVYSSQRIWDVSMTRSVAESLRLPLVIHLHVTCSKWLGKGVEEAIREARMVIAVSEFVRRDAIAYGIPSHRVRTLHNSVAVPPPLSDEALDSLRGDVRREFGIPADGRMVLMAARMTPVKGQEELLAALLPPMKRDRRVHIVFAGAEYPGPNGMSERLTTLASHAGVASQLHIAGFRNDVPRLLDACDIFAHPSRAEPFCLAILEAMAHGRAVVALDEGGPAELVANGQTGILVSPDDTPGLEIALEHLLTSPETTRDMGTRGRERAATAFDLENAAKAFVSLLREAAYCDA